MRTPILIAAPAAIGKDVAVTAVEIAGIVVPTVIRRFVCEHVRKHGHDPIAVDARTVICRACLCRASLDERELHWTAA